MAGSYNHVVVPRTGNLKSNEGVVASLETFGDAFEAVEEMFGMIWWLACEGVNMSEIEKIAVESDPTDRFKRVKEWVEKARQNYNDGLEFSKEIHRLLPDNRRGGVDE